MLPHLCFMLVKNMFNMKEKNVRDSNSQQCNVYTIMFSLCISLYHESAIVVSQRGPTNIHMRRRCLTVYTSSIVFNREEHERPF